MEEIRRSVDSGCIVGDCFLDLSKAFVITSHAKLVSKLTNCDVNGIELEWFRDYTFNQKVQVMHVKCLSELKTFSGVTRGSILGPLPFVIFFNDIVLELNQTKIIKYADDTVIFFANKDYEDYKVERALCSDMNRLSEWFTKNKLFSNLKPGNTELLVFGTNQRLTKIPKNLEVIYNHQVFNVTTLYKYHRVELTEAVVRRCSVKRASGTGFFL